MKVFEVTITESKTATYVLEAEDHDSAVEEAKTRLYMQTKPPIKPYLSTKVTTLGTEGYTSYKDKLDA